MLRVKQQNEQFRKMAEEIHHGSKEDLLAGIAHSVSSSSTKQDSINSENDWDGHFTVQDIVELTRMIHDYRAGKSVYDTLTR